MDKQSINQTNIKIALSMIIEEHEPVKLVKRAIESIKDGVDAVFVTVTYKEDEPTDSPLLSYLNDIGAHITFFRWVYKFDLARNFAIDQIPKDEYMYYVWIDTDDVWQNPNQIKKIVNEMYISNITSVFFEYLYDVELDSSGKIKEVLVTHKRERIIRHDNSVRWVGKLHETLIDQKKEITKIFKKECSVVHLSNKDRFDSNLTRNIQILEDSVREEQRKDPRTLMYLAKGYFDRARGHEKEEDRLIDFQLAEELFKEYLDGSGTPGKDYRGGSGWREERSTAWEYLGEIFRYRHEFNRAIRAALNSLLEAPEFPNYYLDLSLTYLLMEDYHRAQIWLDVGKRIEIPDTTIILMPRDLKARALQIDYQIALAKNELDRAKTSVEKLIDLFPNDLHYVDMYKKIDEARMRNKVAQSIVYIGKYLEQNGHNEQLKALVGSVPPEIEEEQFVSQMKHRFLPPKIHESNEITIMCGPGFEKWSPKNVNSGIGGSEAAVIYQAEQLAKIGYKVTVYGDPKEDAGIYNGVEYKQWYQMNIKDNFNIVILWRAVGFVDQPIKASKIYLWMHDVPNVPDFTEDRVSKLTKIMVLSEYHKSLFKQVKKDGSVIDIPDKKFFITANGVPHFDFDKKIPRDNHKMIYASSYDRGLAHLLLMWKKIKESVPDATLDIYYGWNLFDKLYRDNPERVQWKNKMIEMMGQDGIKEHGRVSHSDLAKAFQRAGIFAYSTDFMEISCQNAMQAQIYGAIPVVTDFAALKETVKFGKKVHVDITETDGKEEYLSTLISVLKDDKYQNEERDKMKKDSSSMFTWIDVAKKWKEEFEK